jgi:SAM-dependent methyltransferase
VKDDAPGVRYQDYVIKDGRLVSDFDGLYRDHPDPWNQSHEDHVYETRRVVAISWCRRLRMLHSPDVDRVLEVGCGFGHMTAQLARDGFSAVGVDVSREAVKGAREKNPSCVFLPLGLEDPNLLERLDPDIVVMAEVTWYVLDYLLQFKDRLREFAESRSRPTFLIHLLTTYAPGVQQYGLDYFSDLDGILDWWSLAYLESGFVASPRKDDPLSRGTYFVAQVR